MASSINERMKQFFEDLTADPVEERVVEYVIREVHNGRRLMEVIERPVRTQSPQPTRSAQSSSREPRGHRRARGRDPLGVPDAGHRLLPLDSEQRGSDGHGQCPACGADSRRRTRPSVPIVRRTLSRAHGVVRSCRSVEAAAGHRAGSLPRVRFWSFARGRSPASASSSIATASDDRARSRERHLPQRHDRVAHARGHRAASAMSVSGHGRGFAQRHVRQRRARRHRASSTNGDIVQIGTFQMVFFCGSGG